MRLFKKSKYLEKLTVIPKRLIDQLDLDEFQKECMRSRWLELLLYVERQAEIWGFRYHLLRQVAIIGGVILTVLVSVISQANNNNFQWITILLSLTITLSTALEEFLQCKEKWKHYRNTSELLNSEGWQFFEKVGSYENISTHKDGFSSFSANVEIIAQKESNEFVVEMIEGSKKKQP